MKLEVIKKLTPSSPEISEKKSKIHNALSTEDVLLKLAYCKLTNKEMDFILGKYLDDDESLSHFYKVFLYELNNNNTYKSEEKDLVCSVVKASLIELTVIKCPFCLGRGFYKLKNNIQKCDHCVDGDFIYTDNIRANILKMNKKEYKKIASMHKNILKEIESIEIDALEKIGDTS